MNASVAKPVVLPSNRPKDRCYEGGPRITSFRREISSGPRTPEDWIASTTSCYDCGSLGQTTLPSGKLLVDEVSKSPEEWLGPEHVDAFGADTKILVKLLDAGQRLPVHAHPHRIWASHHLGAKHGKAEAWYFLTPGEVLLGLKRDVSAEELFMLMERQDVTALTGLMHRLEVKPHQSVYVPPGVLHAIGDGHLIVEVQEPEDLSILLEWNGFEIDGWKDGHLGLDPKVVLTAVERHGRSEDDVRALIHSDVEAVGDKLVKASNEYFRLERIKYHGVATSEAGFAIIIVLRGEVVLGTEHDGDFCCGSRGMTAVVPHRSGKIDFRGHGEALIARPPLPRWLQGRSSTNSLSGHFLSEDAGSVMEHSLKPASSVCL